MKAEKEKNEELRDSTLRCFCPNPRVQQAEGILQGKGGGSAGFDPFVAR